MASAAASRRPRPTRRSREGRGLRFDATRETARSPLRGGLFLARQSHRRRSLFLEETWKGNSGIPFLPGPHRDPAPPRGTVPALPGTPTRRPYFLLIQVKAESAVWA